VFIGVSDPSRCGFPDVCKVFGTAGCRLTVASVWKTRAVREVLVLSALLGLLGVVVWIGMLLWAAREDGRDQERRDRELGR
jgi:hypothetical protein